MEPLNNIPAQDGFAIGEYYQSSTINVGSWQWELLMPLQAPISHYFSDERGACAGKQVFDWAERKDIKRIFAEVRLIQVWNEDSSY